MNTEPKPRMVALTLEQAAPLLARQADVDVLHVYFRLDGVYLVKADEWRAFQAISGENQ